MLTIAIAIAASLALGYQLFAIAACIAFKQQTPETGGQTPAVSILKPVHGVEPAMREAIESHTVLAGEYEFLCGVRAGDPAQALIAQFPKAQMVPVQTSTPNGKVGVLMDLAKIARYPVLIVNDADIRVESDYIQRVTAPLADPKVGLVTCLYRAEGATLAARFEGLGIATDFAPSTLVARLVGVDEFAMGSTMVFRRTDLDRIGGFEEIANYLADDFQLGRRIHSLGLKCVLSDVVVTTHLGGSWTDVWQHQLRWARTIRVSKPGGYIGLPVTFATVWAVIAAAAGLHDLAANLLMARLAMSLISGWMVVRSRDVLALCWMIPLRDLFGAAIWCAGLFGKTVIWRGRRLKLSPDGQIR